MCFFFGFHKTKTARTISRTKKKKKKPDDIEIISKLCDQPREFSRSISVNRAV